MSCVLRAAGRQFDVDAFLARFSLEPLGVWRKGEPRSKGAEPSETSGVRFEVSPSEFSDLSAQSRDALEFFQSHSEWVTSLATFPGVESIVADFGVESHPPHWSSYRFAPALLAALSAAGVSLELSTYPTTEQKLGDA